jgi:hypothetical protein
LSFAQVLQGEEEVS